MPLSEDVRLIKRRRQDLRIWLIENDMTLKELADAAGIKPPSLDSHLNKQTMPVDHHRVLVSGANGLKKAVPACLLPSPKNLRPGRKPRPSFASATV